MDEKAFLESYLRPSESKLDKSFVHPLPDIEGLEKCGQFIVQGELDETFSTNIISKYTSKSLGVNLIDVYKCTQHKKEGVFVGLVGTMSIVKKGYPFLFLDAAVTNVSPLTTQKEDLTIRVAIHLPQSETEQRKMIYDGLTEKAKEIGITCKEMGVEHLPEFWGPIWLGASKKVDLDLIKNLRNCAGSSYVALIKQTRENPSLDHRPVQEQMVFNASAREHMLFNKMGLTVPIEAQAAFFAVMTSGAGR